MASSSPRSKDEQPEALDLQSAPCDLLRIPKARKFYAIGDYVQKSSDKIIHFSAEADEVVEDHQMIRRIVIISEKAIYKFPQSSIIHPGDASSGSNSFLSFEERRFPIASVAELVAVDNDSSIQGHEAGGLDVQIFTVSDETGSTTLSFTLNFGDLQARRQAFLLTLSMIAPEVPIMQKQRIRRIVAKSSTELLDSQASMRDEEKKEHQKSGGSPQSTATHSRVAPAGGPGGAPQHWMAGDKKKPSKNNKTQKPSTSVSASFGGAGGGKDRSISQASTHSSLAKPNRRSSVSPPSTASASNNQRSQIRSISEATNNNDFGVDGDDRHSAGDSWSQYKPWKRRKEEGPLAMSLRMHYEKQAEEKAQQEWEDAMRAQQEPSTEEFSHKLQQLHSDLIARDDLRQPRGSSRPVTPRRAGGSTTYALKEDVDRQAEREEIRAMLFQRAEQQQTDAQFRETNPKKPLTKFAKGVVMDYEKEHPERFAPKEPSDEELLGPSMYPLWLHWKRTGGLLEVRRLQKQKQEAMRQRMRREGGGAAMSPPRGVAALDRRPSVVSAELLNAESSRRKLVDNDDDYEWTLFDSDDLIAALKQQEFALLGSVGAASISRIKHMREMVEREKKMFVNAQPASKPAMSRGCQQATTFDFNSAMATSPGSPSPRSGGAFDTSNGPFTSPGRSVKVTKPDPFRLSLSPTLERYAARKLVKDDIDEAAGLTTPSRQQHNAPSSSSPQQQQAATSPAMRHVGTRHIDVNEVVEKMKSSLAARNAQMQDLQKEALSKQLDRFYR